MDEQAIKSAATAVLINKLQKIGYKPLPTRVSDDVLCFSGVAGKQCDVIIRTLNLDRSHSVSINKREFDYTTRAGLWVFLVLYMKDTEPYLYLIL